jgi:hypothetical protein
MAIRETSEVLDEKPFDDTRWLLVSGPRWAVVTVSEWTPRRE